MTNTYLLELAVKIAMIDNDYETLQEFVNEVELNYGLLEMYGKVKLNNGLTMRIDGTAVRE